MPEYRRLSLGLEWGRWVGGRCGGERERLPSTESSIHSKESAELISALPRQRERWQSRAPVYITISLPQRSLLHFARFSLISPESRPRGTRARALVAASLSPEEEQPLKLPPASVATPRRALTQSSSLLVALHPFFLVA